MVDYDFDDFQLEAAPKKRAKKKANSGAKGKRGERHLCKILSDRFNNLPFIRTLGSGNRWAQVQDMPDHAKETFTADIVCPKGFLFCIECKEGYEDVIKIDNIFEQDYAKLEEWFRDAIRDAKACNRKPLICWKRARKPYVAFILNKDLKGSFNKRLIIDKWVCVSLNKLLELSDDFFFEGTDEKTV